MIPVLPFWERRFLFCSMMTCLGSKTTARESPARAMAEKQRHKSDRLVPWRKNDGTGVTASCLGSKTTARE